MNAYSVDTDGKVERISLSDDYRARDVQLRQLVGGHWEHVAVLFDGKPATLIVNENGAVQDPPLAPNARATSIYWTATALGRTPVPFNPLTMAMIHGPAVLIEIDKRAL